MSSQFQRLNIGVQCSRAAQSNGLFLFAKPNPGPRPVASDAPASRVTRAYIFFRAGTCMSRLWNCRPAEALFMPNDLSRTGQQQVAGVSPELDATAKTTRRKWRERLQRDLLKIWLALSRYGSVASWRS
jgi:hypothetical protein